MSVYRTIGPLVFVVVESYLRQTQFPSNQAIYFKFWRPKMSWKTLTERDHREWNLNQIDPCDKDVWRSCVRSAKLAASQLPGWEPTDVDDAPAHAH